jgi:hypothetical protein
VTAHESFGEPDRDGVRDGLRDGEGRPPLRRASFGRVHHVVGQAAARAVLVSGGDDIVIIERGRARTVLFNCPDRCGDIVVINVDPVHRPVWRLALGDHGVTLMPSVWRTSGCRAHFIVWRSQILWCSGWSAWDADGDQEHEPSTQGDDWFDEVDAALRKEWRRVRTEWVGNPASSPRQSGDEDAT